MKRRNNVLVTILGVFTFLGFLCLKADVAEAQDWSRIALPGGGVVEDMQILAAGSDVVWAAAMGSGLFRSEWQSGTSSYSAGWDEYLPGTGCLGMDAVYFTPTGGSATEYVMVSTGGSGVKYDASTTGTFTQSEWGYPSGYPTTHDWKNTKIHDVAFYCNTSGSYPAPEEEYFILMIDVEDWMGSSWNSGIYRWDTSLQPDAFARVDDDYSSDPGSQFTKFFRDMGTPNVLFVMGDNPDCQGSHEYPTTFYRISGGYSSLDFEELDIARMAGESGDYTIDALGFSQWKSGSTIHSYVLVKWWDNSENEAKRSIFLSMDLSSASPTFKEVEDKEYDQYQYNKRTKALYLDHFAQLTP
ncbi:hypothetical protein CEE37_14690 [candidate division LCP-89 bacterium B3_LCP]|uniref:Uncharacterized protein n=1 Tax=candidate division LCP-89 bacterium B3_LCP TaxID=2012998 RepID=A0A532UPH1_UNCL8|nr:MAG: hypothetical protein CEE37_14690 [candidate division LCP-89 bacterium B3_LCP]